MGQLSVATSPSEPDSTHVSGITVEEVIEFRDCFAFLGLGNRSIDWLTKLDLDDSAHEWLTRLHWEEPSVLLGPLSLAAQKRKRRLDVIVSLTMLVGLSPILALTAVLVRLTSRGPAIFRQERIGLESRHVVRRTKPRVASGSGRGDRRSTENRGRPFVLFKFRTMRTDAEKDGARFAERNDPRVTPIGRFLRRTRLDELPQLWNVLKGDMSMVGPRPERAHFIEALENEIPGYVNRLRLRPGLTGLAQVVNGYDNQIEGFKRKVAYDLLYLKNCCIRNDLKILMRTVWVVLSGKGAL